MLPMLAVMGGIFYLSHQPGSSLPLPEIIGLDKLLHGVAYAGLAMMMGHAFPEWLERPLWGFRGGLIVLFCLLYGASDEFHQSFIPNRFVSLADWLADGLGALCWVVVANRRSRK